MKQSHWEDKSRHMKKKKLIWNNQHGFSSGESCLTNLIALCDGMDGTVDK